MKNFLATFKSCGFMSYSTQSNNSLISFVQQIGLEGIGLSDTLLKIKTLAQLLNVRSFLVPFDKKSMRKACWDVKGKAETSQPHWALSLLGYFSLQDRKQHRISIEVKKGNTRAWWARVTSKSRVWGSLFFGYAPITWPLTGSIQNGLLRPKP